MTEFADIDGGRIAYDVTGQGPLVVLSHGIGDRRTDAQAQLPGIRCPALIIMGTEDPDFADPRAEGEAIAAAIPAGLGTVTTIAGAGHYPHAQCPDEAAALVIPFLNEHARA